MSRPRFTALALAGALAASPALSQTSDSKSEKARPEVFERLIACRAITDQAQRLACFDANAAALDEAARNAEIVVIDKQRIKDAERSLFGFDTPSVARLLSSDRKPDPHDSGLASIDTTVASASANRQGKLRIELADGSVWVQTDGRYIGSPRPGTPIRIRKAALGSYMAVIGNRAAIRVMRER
jgi:hypothetical protein